MSGFDPNSSDAMFSKIIQRLDAQDQALGRIEQGVNKTNGRVSSLERERWYQRGVVAAIAVLVGIAWDYFKSSR